MGSIFWILLVTFTANWVYFDATQNKIGKIPNNRGFFNLSAGAWCAVTLGIWIIGFPAYIIKRSTLLNIAKTNPVNVKGRIIKMIFVGLISFFWIVFSLNTFLKMDLDNETNPSQSQTYPSANFQDIKNQVAQDALNQYEIAKRNGATNMDLCVQAQLVSAAFLQAQNESLYSEWKRIEKNHCQQTSFSGQETNINPSPNQLAANTSSTPTITNEIVRSKENSCVEEKLNLFDRRLQLKVSRLMKEAEIKGTEFKLSTARLSEIQNDAKLTAQASCSNEKDALISGIPSFDCSKLNQRINQIICKNNELAALDVKLSNSFQSILVFTNNKEAFLADSRTWLASRKECQDESCLVKMYQDRINQFQEVLE